MAIFLKQSTSIDVRLGPFVDVGDGFTPETGVTIAASDEAEILKANGAATVAMAGTLAAVTGCDGWYDYTLSAGDTDTVGELVIVMQDDSVYLPVFQRFYVLEEAVYDDLFAAAADPFTVLQSDAAATEITASDTHSRLVVVEAAIDSDQVSRTSAVSDVHSRLVVVEGSVDSDQTSRTTAISDIKSEVTKVYSDTTRIELALVTATGSLEGTPSSTVLQTDLAELTDNHYNNMVFVMTSGDEAGEARRIDAYTGTTGTITLKTALSGAPTAAETFAILNIPVYGDAVYSDTTAVEVTTSDTHSRLVVVEAAVDSDQLSRATAISDVKSRLVVVESAIDSDQVSRTTAISDVKSELTKAYSDTTAIHSQTTVIEGVVPKQNTALNNIEFLFVAASDHVTPVTGATGTAVTRSVDGGAFGAGTGTLAEVGNGIYQYDASAADMNGGTVTFRFTATGGTPGAPDDAFVTIHTSGAQ